MLLLILVNFFSLLHTRKELRNYLTAIKAVEQVMSNNSSGNIPNNISTSTASGWLGLGDSFSSFAYIDEKKTNMVLDEAVTAFVFPPVYSLEKISDLDVVDEGENNDWVVLGKKDACQFSLDDNCLRVDENSRLLYNDREIDLPMEMQGEEIRNIDVSFLSSIFVVSFVVSDSNQERAYAYFFNGNRYSPLISKNTSEKIVTEYGMPGGIMSAGGSDNDFIIIYSGYEVKAFHYQLGRLTDISKFFGLRVANGGFYPYIIKQGDNENSLWYVLSLDAGKIKLIKLWQNGSREIKGAYDFSYKFKDYSSLKLLAFREPASSRGQLQFIFNRGKSRSLSPKEPGTWLFHDKGFDNSRERKIVSLNLNDKGGNLTKAFVENMFFNSGYGLAEKLMAKVFFFGDNQKKIEVELNKEVGFIANNQSLFWELVFMPEQSPEYSPWFDHISHLYFFIE